MLLERTELTGRLGRARVVPTPRPSPSPGAARPVRLAHRGARRWVRRYQRLLLTAEVLAAALTGAVVVAVHPAPITPHSDLLWASASLVVSWPALIAACGGYDQRLFDSGGEEYRRVGRAGLVLLAVLGFVSYAAALELSRALVVLGVPALTLLTLVGRYVARQLLHTQRASGRCVKRVVLVGRGGAALDLLDRMRRTPHVGLDVVALCVPLADRTRVEAAVELPVSGLEDVLGTTARTGADAVAVTSASDSASAYLRTLSWQLEGSGLELLVAPGLVEVAGPRLHIRPFDGLPLLSVEQPTFSGWRRVVKNGLDRSVALAGLVALLPVLVAIALLVRRSGPVFYRQQRVGLGGVEFSMLKFRSMVVGADQQVAGLSDGNDADGLLFKMKADPRVTPVGRWLRRLSLDELPQLVNVVKGEMSLVGPRPPLPVEVARYDSSVSRRLLVKPGLTGLWQISGRSDLPWEEAVRLDLRYVENWSLALDLLILWKTVRAVVTASGAY